MPTLGSPTAEGLRIHRAEYLTSVSVSVSYFNLYCNANKSCYIDAELVFGASATDCDVVQVTKHAHYLPLITTLRYCTSDVKRLIGDD